jgi:hypothetical protein
LQYLCVRSYWKTKEFICRKDKLHSQRNTLYTVIRSLVTHFKQLGEVQQNACQRASHAILLTTRSHSSSGKHWVLCLNHASCNGLHIGLKTEQQKDTGGEGSTRNKSRLYQGQRNICCLLSSVEQNETLKPKCLSPALHCLSWCLSAYLKTGRVCPKTGGRRLPLHPTVAVACASGRRGIQGGPCRSGRGRGGSALCIGTVRGRRRRPQRNGAAVLRAVLRQLRRNGSKLVGKGDCL